MINIVFSRKAVVYLPLKEFRLLFQQYLLVTEIFRAYVYYLDFNERFPETNNRWVIDTKNSYYDSMILRWCMLFGSRSEPTHFTLLFKNTEPLTAKMKLIGINDKEQLVQFLTKNTDLSDQKLKQYWKVIKDYRDRNLIHRENDPSQINDNELTYPYTTPLIKTAFNLFLILKNLFETYPNQKDAIYSEEATYDQINSLDDVIQINKICLPIVSF